MDNKQENVVNMIKDFGKILMNLPDGKLREEFNAFVYQLTFGNKSLPEILEWIEKSIAKASSVRHQDTQVNAKTTVQFWEKVRDVIVKTFQENKDESQ